MRRPTLDVVIFMERFVVRISPPERRAPVEEALVCTVDEFERLFAARRRFSRKRGSRYAGFQLERDIDNNFFKSS
jgi:hypothetical protein